MEKINYKPNLVDNKLLYQIKQKNKIEEFDSEKFFQPLFYFIFKNIGFILFFIFLFCILSYRYYEVKKKKNNMKIYYDNTYI